MVEKEIVDRVPLYPGRMTLEPVEGHTNTYDMVRADSPRVAGTPINKATLDSIIQSRLTGRYYTPTVSYAVGADSRIGLTVSPIPTSGWVYDAGNTNRATSGGYVVTSNSNNGTSWQADGAFRSAGWQSSGGDEAWLQIYHAQKLKVRAVRFEIEAEYSSRLSQVKIQGSNNGTSWTDLYTVTSPMLDSDVTYTLPTTGDFSYYRVVFTNTDSNRITVKDFRYILYDINTYSNVFNIAKGMPGSFTDGQRLTIKTPASVSTFAITSNTLNGIPVNTILQPSKRYELRYNGAAFDTKEM